MSDCINKARRQLFKAIHDKIKKNRATHDQSEWIDGQSCDIRKIEGKYDCKTPCCFAGHIAYEANFNFKPLLKLTNKSIVDDVAMDISGIDPDLFRMLVQATFGKQQNAIKQTDLYLNILKWYSEGMTDNCVVVLLLELHTDDLEDEDIYSLTRILKNAY